jgi:hypothetical protein
MLLFVCVLDKCKQMPFSVVSQHDEMTRFPTFAVTVKSAVILNVKQFSLVRVQCQTFKVEV